MTERGRKAQAQKHSKYKEKAGMRQQYRPSLTGDDTLKTPTSSIESASSFFESECSSAHCNEEEVGG